MPIIQVILVLVVIGLLLAALTRWGAPYLDRKILTIIHVVVVVATVLWLLWLFGLLPGGMVVRPLR